MSVTVVSCVYGSTFARFIPRWVEYVSKLNPKPDAIVVASDRPHKIPGAHVFVPPAAWNHPQAYYLNAAIAQADTEWVWILDIDDCAKPDALQGLERVDAGVWQMGYIRSDGEVYIPGPEALDAPGNMLVAGSAVRREHARFADVAYQDWHLWRRLQREGFEFAFSGRTHFHYMRHKYTRGETELGLDRRDELVEEMELALA